MKQFYHLSVSILSVLFLIAFIATISGCGGDADLETQLSGKYKAAENGDTVDIQLAKESASLTLDGHVYAAVIEKVDRMSNTVTLKVKTESGNEEAWSLHQKWNDNGSEFKVNLMRNGDTKTLVPLGQS